jgi:hypothetical protein
MIIPREKSQYKPLELFTKHPYTCLLPLATKVSDQKPQQRTSSMEPRQYEDTQRAKLIGKTQDHLRTAVFALGARFSSGILLL